MKIKFGLVFLLGAISLNLHAQESTDLDSVVVVRAIDVYLEYCTSTDSAIEHAIEIGFPIQRPSLAINRVVINDEKEIDIIRNCFNGIWLGPYRISKKKRYSSAKAEDMGFYGVSKDGLVVISLKRNEIFDINCLESWLKDMIKNNPQYLKETIHNSYRYIPVYRCRTSMNRWISSRSSRKRRFEIWSICPLFVYVGINSIFVSE